MLIRGRRILFLILGLVVLIRPDAEATHNRAGEITYRQISDLTFEITIWTYTYTLSAADRPQLPVIWGDGTESIASRSESAMPSVTDGCTTARAPFQSSVSMSP